jgi:kynureninase
MHGIDPKDGMLFAKPRPGEYTIRTEDIVEMVRENSHSISLILLPGVQYYTGQLFDMQRITAVGHEIVHATLASSP